MPTRLSRPVTTALMIVVGLSAIVAPMALAARIAYSQGLAAERSHARSYAREALRRADATTDQADQAIKRLAALGATGVGRCSDESLALMRNLDVSSDYIQAMGAMSGTVVTCDSVGGGREAVDLGPADVTTPSGASVWNQVRFPYAPGQQFIAVGRDGFVVIVHRALVIDITDDQSVSLAVFTVPNGLVVTSRGQVDARWLTEVVHRYPVPARQPRVLEETFTRDGHLVAAVTSSRRYIGAISAFPIGAVDRRAHRGALLLVPVGAAAGVILALTVLYFARQRLGLPAVLRSALRHREFFLVYQPIVDLDTGRWCGAEALIRWQRHDGELIHPDLFVPIAERCLGADFTTHVVDLVAEDLGALKGHHPDFYVSINVTPMDLERGGTVDLFRGLVAKTGVPPELVAIETTERIPLNRDKACRVIRQLRQFGFGVVIDDFGTGYSSLSYLQALEVTALKIDKSFVESLGTDAPTNQVAFHIIEMAKELKLGMVAEGVENEAQARVLGERGVRLAQGWLFSEPLTWDELILALESAPELPPLAERFPA